MNAALVNIGPGVICPATAIASITWALVSQPSFTTNSDLRKARRSYAALIKDAFRIGKIIATGPFAEKLQQLQKIVNKKLARYEGVLQQIEGKKGQKGIAD